MDKILEREGIQKISCFNIKYIEKITLVKIEAPTAFIYDILKNINNYFYEDKMWRTVVSLHSYTRSIGIKIFYGTENDLYCNYSILLNNESMQKKNKN